MNQGNGSAIARIKERWPLRAMAQRLGIELPQRDNQKFRHPFRPDRNPSCTVHGEAIHDWSQGDGKPMDAIALFALAKGLENREAIRELMRELEPGREFANESDSMRNRPPGKPAMRSANNPGLLNGRPPAPTTPPGGTQPRKNGPVAPPPYRALEIPTMEEIDRLVALRGFYRETVFQAIAAGHLFCADTREGRAWVVTDATGQLAQSRRLDGRPWEGIRSKAWTTVKEAGLAGWPLGAAEIADRPRVLLCEGGPDWIVAHEAAPEFAVCAMLGAKQVIHPTALRHFGGKAVRILAHGDEAGAAAARRWAVQLAAVQARVTAVKIEFGEARDLNDCARLPVADGLKHQIFTLLC